MILQAEPEYYKQRNASGDASPKTFTVELDTTTVHVQLWLECTFVNLQLQNYSNTDKKIQDS